MLLSYLRARRSLEAFEGEQTNPALSDDFSNGNLSELFHVMDSRSEGSLEVIKNVISISLPNPITASKKSET